MNESPSGQEIPAATDLDMCEAATGPPEPAYPRVQHGLLSRHHECGVLDRLMAGVRAGQCQVLVLRGEAGAGKTALLNYVLKRAGRCQIMRAAGAESEMELPFAALHQLCAPFLGRLGHLPGPQRDALGVAFGVRDGDVPDRFLASVGFSSLLSGSPRSGRSSAWLMMRSGSMSPRHGLSRSSHATWPPDPSRCSWRCARPIWTVSWRGWPSCLSEGWPTVMPGCCCPRP
jgi:hypothetical protein